LRFWIRDPEDGVNNVRSDLYLAIWDAFETAGITIPFPQRDLHLRGDWPPTKA
jgi:small-conductance mechanosensitive channel